MSVLIAGCGWLGTALGRDLVRRGERVVAVRRNRDAAAELREAGFEPRIADLADPGQTRSLPTGVEWIVACPSADVRSVEAYRRAYVDVLRNLLRLAEHRGVRGVVYTGSTGVFGQRDGGRVDERSPTSPADESAGVLCEAERLVLDAADGGVPARVVRLSGLYGPGRTGVIERVRDGRLALGPGDDAWMNWCHRDDAVAAVLAALTRAPGAGPFHATDACPARRREVVGWIAERLGVEPRRRREAGGGRGSNRRISGERTREQLGLELAYPSFRDGLAPHLPRAR